MDFGFTEDLKFLRKSMRDFVDNEIKGDCASDLSEDPSKMFSDYDMQKYFKVSRQHIFSPISN